jgi:signal transduction histidine kinase
VKSRLRLAWLVVLALPPLLLAAAGLLASRSEDARLEREVGRVVQARLAEQAAALGEVVARLERDLLADTQTLPADPEALRELARRTPRLAHLLILGTAGELVFPPPDGPQSADERRFLAETRALWDRGSVAFPPVAEGSRPGLGDHGWQAVGWGDGGALFWRSGPPGRVVVGIPGPTLLAALVEKLPVTLDRAGGTPVEERTALYDAGGHVAYQWGRYAPPPTAAPLFTAALPDPLEAWRLGYLGPPPPAGRAWALAAGIAGLALALGLAGAWTWRESGRALRDAENRVSFVNQVSHELKTPLTNVRLYAELLEDHLPDDDTVAQQRLGVLLAECRRLGRLINNVLTFARARRSPQVLHPQPGCVDEVVRELATQFEPALAAKSIALRLEAGAPRTVEIDADALSQMLGNLLGNVEKYAPGAPVVVRTEQSAGAVRITVHDGGPGIPAADRARVFEPFVRLGGATHEAVPGTGIGLGIARDLARLHGGDLVAADDGGSGACFVLTIAAREVA